MYVGTIVDTYNTPSIIRDELEDIMIDKLINLCLNYI